MNAKKYLNKNVYKAAIERLELIFSEFEKVYFSFSGGKDSSMLVHLAIDVAKKMKKLPVVLLFIDLEAQYRMTIEHVREMFEREETAGYWICLPFNLRNAVSVFQPHWICWDKNERDKWVRDTPQNEYVVNNEEFFPFFYKGMEFEEFVIKFGKWFSAGEKTACCVAIRSDESLNRFRTIKSLKKITYKSLGYSTRLFDNLYNFYPIYDWKTEDIWTAVGKFGWSYNKIYDFMYMQGRSIHEARICQPYGDDQRKGLDLFRYCEPETWFKVVNRVAGANFGNIYARSFLLGTRKAILPEGFTWKTYTEFLLQTLPRYEAEWYKRKFEVFFKWWEKHGYPRDEIPDEADSHLEARKKIPSWRRLAKCILKNDRLCKSLSFAQTKYQYEKYKKLKEEYGE